MATRTVAITATIQRHHPQLPRYIVVPAARVSRWRLTGATVVEGAINGTPLGRRTLKQWDAERWFIDLPEAVCRAAEVETGDRVQLDIRLAPAALPAELERLLAQSPRARTVWRGLTASRQRMIREHVLAAKRAGTRERRARGALGMTANS